METITVTIHKGNVQIETKGFPGAECREATAAIEKALGGVESERLTPEFYHKPVAQKQKVGGR